MRKDQERTVEDQRFKVMIVQLILMGNTEEALEVLSKHYTVSVPKIQVGLPKGHKRNSVGCYTTRNGVISVLDSSMMKEPFVILHEFYHHMRTGLDNKHKGTERHANEFARGFMDAYAIVAGVLGTINKKD